MIEFTFHCFPDQYILGKIKLQEGGSSVTEIHEADLTCQVLYEVRRYVPLLFSLGSPVVHVPHQHYAL